MREGNVFYGDGLIVHEEKFLYKFLHNSKNERKKKSYKLWPPEITVNKIVKKTKV